MIISCCARPKKEFDGELVLFVTDTSVQRHGIGTTLLRQFYQFMEQNNSKNIYLFTDTTCNYGYYQKKGYRQIAENVCTTRRKEAPQPRTTSCIQPAWSSAPGIILKKQAETACSFFSTPYIF